MCLRVYAITGGKKLLSGALSILIVAQLGFGIYFIFVNATTPCEFLDRLFVRVWSHSHYSGIFAEYKLGRVQGLLSPKMATWGGYLHQYFRRLWCVLTIRLPT